MAANVVQMKLISSTGEFSFDDYEPPIVGRRIDHVRKGDQGHSRQQVNITLNGFFEGNNHKEIVDKYEKLKKVVECNDAILYYHDGAREVINKRVYLDAIAEPESWKFYDGFYSVNLHYFEEPTYDATQLGITASYSSSAGPYNFDHAPFISFGSTPNRDNHRGLRTSLGGTIIQPTVDIRLDGFLTAANHAALMVKKAALEAAFSQDGTLNYGSLSMRLFVERVEFGSTFPRDYIDFGISAKFEAPGIREFSATRTFSRLHRNPKIRMRPFCGNPLVRLLSISGQEIGYYMKAKGDSITECRNFLSQEAQLYVFGGGVEQPGGTEVENINEISLTLNFRKFHSFPIVDNVPNT